jgi:transcriptional regulator with XRE-family HTH domain
MNPILEKWHELHKKYLYINKGEYAFTTSDLAKSLGVTRRTIQRWLKGEGSPKDIHLERIKAYLETKIKE